jgi:CheY-like chemotaxis protein
MLIHSPFTEPFSALNNFCSGLYNLIMIDIVLPKMKGFELYHKIRKLDNKVKICFLTASDMYFEEIRTDTFPELDTNHFIRKPISNEDSFNELKTYLQIIKYPKTSMLKNGETPASTMVCISYSFFLLIYSPPSLQSL